MLLYHCTTHLAALDTRFSVYLYLPLSGFFSLLRLPAEDPPTLKAKSFEYVLKFLGAGTPSHRVFGSPAVGTSREAERRSLLGWELPDLSP